VAFDPDVAARAVAPVAGNPAGVGVGWSLVDAGDPDITLTIPAGVAGVPGPVAGLGGRGWDAFAGRWRRTDADGELGLCDAGGEEKSASAEEEVLSHVMLLVLLKG
jgi:hypothetical protein